MPDKETAKGTSGWTVETLYVHFSSLLEQSENKNQQQFADADKAVQAALSAAEKAVNKAEVNASNWRENANEWRAAMSDRERNFAPIQRLESLEHRFDMNEGAGAGLKAMWGYVLAAILLIIAIAGLYLKSK